MTQLAHESGRRPGVTVIGDTQERLNEWFNARDDSVVILRPDRIVAVACQASQLDSHVKALATAMVMLPH
jgi:3-(3-hydroxy-phenyl)propionate hydroxylase